MADNNNFAAGSGSTVGGSTTSSAGSSSSSPSSGSNSYSDTNRPTGSTTTSSQGTGANFSAGSSYQPQADFLNEQDNDVTYAERSQSRPSTAVIAGAALAGAITGGAIPFLLAGRKSRQTSQLNTSDSDYQASGSRSALFSRSGIKQR